MPSRARKPPTQPSMNVERKNASWTPRCQNAIGQVDTQRHRLAGIARSWARKRDRVPWTVGNERIRFRHGAKYRTVNHLALAASCMNFFAPCGSTGSELDERRAGRRESGGQGLAEGSGKADLWGCLWTFLRSFTTSVRSKGSELCCSWKGLDHRACASRCGHIPLGHYHLPGRQEDRGRRRKRLSFRAMAP